MQKRNRIATTVGLILLLFILFDSPLLPLFLWSFAQEWRYPELLPSFSLRAWQYGFSASSQMLEALWTGMLLGIATAVTAQLFAYPLARAMGLYLTHGKRLLQFLVFAPMLIPGISISMGMHILFIRLGLSDTVIGVFLAHLVPAISYAGFVLYNFYAHYDTGWEKQVRMLGASRLTVFRLVEWPFLRPTIATSLLFTFLLSWSQYVITVLIGGGQVVTLPVLLFSAVNSGDYPVMGAISVVYLLPVLLFLFIHATILQTDATKGNKAL